MPEGNLNMKRTHVPDPQQAIKAWKYVAKMASLVIDNFPHEPMMQEMIRQARRLRPTMYGYHHARIKGGR